MDISSIGGNGPFRSHSPVLQNASPVGAGPISSDAVNDANKGEIAAEKPLPILGAPEVEREEGREEATEKSQHEGPLSPEEKDIVDHLKTVDREVRAHEQAHLSAAGPYATGGASFQFTTGPDGRPYAVGGEVGIDASAESSPQATIQKMQVVRAAALAPANPSAQDMSVAASASATEALARAQLAKEQGANDEASSKANDNDDRSTPEQVAASTANTPPPLGSGDVPVPQSTPARDRPAIEPPGVVPPGSGDRVHLEDLPVLGQGEPLMPAGTSVAERLMERNNVAPFVTDKTSSPVEIATKSYARGAQVESDANVDVVA